MYLASFDSDNLTAGSTGKNVILKTHSAAAVSAWKMSKTSLVHGGRGFGLEGVQDFVGGHDVFTGKNVILKTHFFHVRYSFAGNHSHICILLGGKFHVRFKHFCGRFAIISTTNFNKK